MSGPEEASGPARAELVRPAGRLTRTDIVRYAGASGDFTRAHHDEPFARELGYLSVYAMGLLPGGVLAEAVRAWVGQDAIAAMSIRFAAMTWPDTDLMVHATVRGTAGAMSVQAALRADGQPAVTAVFRLTEAACHEWSNGDA